MALFEHKDVVLALLGASAGFGGLTLVFLGLVVSSFQSLAVPVPGAIRSQYQHAALFVLTAFLMSLACVVVAAFWLLDLQENDSLYAATVGTFLAQIALLVASTCFVVRRLLWRKA